MFYSEDDSGFIADAPDLKYCSAFGKALEEAVKEIMIAAELWFETAIEDGQEIPQPRYKPAIYQI